MAQLAAEVEAYQAFAYHCCEIYAQGIYDVKLCSMAKLLGTELSEKVATQCLQMYGGYGYMEEYKMARMFRDSRILTIGGGSSEIMREIIAKMVIDDVSYQSAHAPAEGQAAHKEQNGNAGLEKVLEQIKAKAAEARPLGNTLKFDFGDQQLYIDGSGEKNAVSTENKEAACLVETSFEDFLALTKGELNPMSAVMSGKVKIKGDMSVAMNLQSLFA